jgi:predicted CopG family antitoxin
MATKTISLELDAYERLKRVKKSPRESFSEVVRRAVWPDATPTGADVLADLLARRKHPESLPNESMLDDLDRAQETPRRGPSKWKS